MSDEVLGREGIVSALVAATTGRGAVVIGPPGSGLSTVLRHATERLGVTNARLVRFPDPRIDPDVLGDDRDEDDDDGAALVVDDAHQGSADQMLALRDRALVRPVVLGVRTGAAPAELSWLWRSGAIAAVELDSLDDATIGRIVEQHAGGAIHRATLDGIVHRSAGRPGFAVDEITSLLADHRLTRQAGLLRGRMTGQVGAHLIDRARELLDGLPGTVAAMVETIAMAGRMPGDALAPLGIDLPELERRGLAGRSSETEGVVVRLAPPGLSLAVRATLPPARALALAREVLAAASTTLAPDDRARLLLLSGERVELAEITAAAWTALRSDDRTEAVNLARQAGRNGPEGLIVEAELLAELGARTEAADRYAAVMVDPAAPAGLRGRAAMEHSLILMWDLSRADDAVVTAAGLAAAARDTPFGPATQVHLGALTMYAGRPIEAAAIVAGVDVDTLERTMRAGLTLVDTIAQALVDPVRAAPEQAMWLIDRDDDGSFERGVSLATVALSLELVGRYRDAEAVLDDARNRSTSRATPTSSAWSSLAVARCELAIGRHQRAKRAALESIADFADVNHPSGVRWATGVSMFASALAGDRDATREAVDAFELLGEGVPFLDADLRRAQAWSAWRLGNSALAADLLRAAIDLAAESGAVALEAVALHDSFRLLHAPVAARLGELAARSPAPAITLRARHVELVAAADARELLELAADFERTGALLLAAEAAGDAARLAAAQGLRSTARTAVGQHVRLADLCGNPMTPSLADHRPITLTTRERDVATLAVGGRTSREIAGEFAVSVRTVDNLLQRVYVKLGVHSRAELADRLSERLP